MRRSAFVITILVIAIIIIASCSKNDSSQAPANPYPFISAALNIDPAKLDNYSNQVRPVYITKDNSGANPITNSKATLGRVLFYDKNLSVDKSISCASCHKQEFAFSDTAIASRGVLGGSTGRHSMRLINSRFANEVKFFWNERAASLELQTTQPIQDHSEMGFSGLNGRENLTALLNRLQGINYYNELFRFVYGDISVTESRLQECLAQFIRSIQSFDSKYDAGRVQVGNDNQPFPNFSPNENLGKDIFLRPGVFDNTGNRINGGLGCAGCHRPPEFDIDPNTRNNGVIGNLNGVGLDGANTRAPSLRDLTKVNGVINGPLMHTAIAKTLRDAIAHYEIIISNPAQNPNLDPRLTPNGMGQRLNLNPTEITGILAFLQTLAGTFVYTDKKWGNPFK
ncbi:MAG TPA: cytochrome c peroxidase [Ferruginibacter sp.]|nr:cytochrome c peroxidase [Ferruginibacter sp.]